MALSYFIVGTQTHTRTHKESNKNNIIPQEEKKIVKILLSFIFASSFFHLTSNTFVLGPLNNAAASNYNGSERAHDRSWNSGLMITFLFVCLFRSQICIWVFFRGVHGWFCWFARKITELQPKKGCHMLFTNDRNFSQNQCIRYYPLQFAIKMLLEILLAMKCDLDQKIRRNKHTFSYHLKIFWFATMSMIERKQSTELKRNKKTEIKSSNSLRCFVLNVAQVYYSK